MSLSKDTAYWAKRQSDVTAAINTLLDGSISPSNPDSQACSPIDNFFSYAPYSPQDSIRSISRGFGQLVRRSSSIYSESASTSSSSSSSGSGGIGPRTPRLVGGGHSSSGSTSSTSTRGGSDDDEKDFEPPGFVRAQTYFLLDDLFNDMDNPKADRDDPDRFTLTFNPESHHYERNDAVQSHAEWQPLAPRKPSRADAWPADDQREGRPWDNPRGVVPAFRQSHGGGLPGAAPGRRGAIQRRKPSPMKIDTHVYKPYRPNTVAPPPPPVPPKVPMERRMVQSQQPWSRPAPRRKYSWEE